MEPTIYEPSIYKGAGIYKTVAEGGGGGVINIDGLDYHYAQMPDGKMWLTENLMCPASFFPYSVTGMWYNNDSATYGRNGLNYGQLYTYGTNMVRNIIEAIPGWHLPSYSEWTNLINACGGGATAAQKLKSSTGWRNNKNGTDDYGFRLVPAGYWHYYGTFNEVSEKGWYATSDNQSSDIYDILEIDYNTGFKKVSDYSDGQVRISVRIVKDT